MNSTIPPKWLPTAAEIDQASARPPVPPERIVSPEVDEVPYDAWNAAMDAHKAKWGEDAINASFDAFAPLPVSAPPPKYVRAPMLVQLYAHLSWWLGKRWRAWKAFVNKTRS